MLFPNMTTESNVPRSGPRSSIAIARASRTPAASHHVDGAGRVVDRDDGLTALLKVERNAAGALHRRRARDRARTESPRARS
jgi:hypothetical protein